MNKKATDELRILMEWGIIIVALIFGTIVIMIYLKHYTSNWLPIK